MPGRPSASGFTTGTVAGAATFNWPHTVVAGEAVYVIVQSILFGNGLAQPTCTLNGVSMSPQLQAANAIVGSISAWIFTLPADTVAAGAQTVLFDNGPRTSTYVGQAINIANPPADACAILAALEYDPFTASFARRAYGWDDLGLLVASGWGFNQVVTFAEGTAIGSGNFSVINTVDSANTEQLFTLSSGAASLRSIVGFLIPPDSTEQPRTDGGLLPWFSFRTPFGGAAVGAVGCAPLPWGGSATIGQEGNLLLVPGTAHAWVVDTNDLPVGVGNTVVAEIFYGGGRDGNRESLGIATGITLTITGGAQIQAERSDLAALLSWARYQRLSVRYTFTAGAGTLPVGLELRSSFLMESGEDATSVYGGGPETFGTGGVGSFFYKAPVHPRSGNWAANADDDKNLMLACTQTEMVVMYQSPTALATDHQFYMEKRLQATPLVAVLQDGSGATVNTTATYVQDSLGPALARSRFSLPFAEGDLMSCAGVQRDAASADLRHVVMIKLVAATRGQMLIAGHSAQSVANDYVAVPNAPEGIAALADESLSAITVPTMTAAGDDFHILGILGYLELTGPDPGTLTQRLRKDLADTSMPDLVFTGSPAAPLYDDVGGDVAYPSLSEITQQFLVASAPTLQRQFWTYIGFVEPPTILGEIIVVKDAGGDVVTSFPFITTGLSPGSFNLVGGGSQSFPGLTPGSGFGVEELPPAGWNDPAVVVSNGSSPNNIAVAEGETVTVTFTNSLCPGDTAGPRTDGLSYSPPSFAPCIGPGVRSGIRQGS